MKILNFIICLYLSQNLCAQTWSDRTSSIGRTPAKPEVITSAYKLHFKSLRVGHAVILIEPNKWESLGDFGEIDLGDPNHYIRGEFQMGMTFFDYDKFQFLNGVVGIGTDNPDRDYKLTVNGKIKAHEIRLEVGGHDQSVLEKSNSLTSLKDLEAFIDKNKHLPGLPSPMDTQTNGISVGEMTNALLGKIEELTLYILEQEKRINKLEQQLKR